MKQSHNRRVLWRRLERERRVPVRGIDACNTYGLLETDRNAQKREMLQLVMSELVEPSRLRKRGSEQRLCEAVRARVCVKRLLDVCVQNSKGGPGAAADVCVHRRQRRVDNLVVRGQRDRPRLRYFVERGIFRLALFMAVTSVRRSSGDLS